MNVLSAVAVFFHNMRGFHFSAAVFRLVLAMLLGGVIGYGRSKKQRNAGLRTYMLVCTGAALTILISMYEYQMLSTYWAVVVEEVGLKFDGTRYAAAVVGGIGFLSAGVIIDARHQQVSGLTTAIGLFVTACLGLAVGAGFFECVIPALLLIIISMESLQPAEIQYKRRIRNISVAVEYGAPEDLEVIVTAVEDRGAQLFELDEEPAAEGKNPFVLLTIRLSREHPSHSAMLSSLAELPCVRSVRELIS